MSFCPLINDCPVEDQFRLENDCCLYCRGHDFCKLTGPTSNHSRCHPEATCESVGLVPGGGGGSQREQPVSLDSMFRCNCRPGFRGDGLASCEDIDECASDHLNDCDPQTTRCVNLPGSFECKCRPGFKKDTSLTAGHLENPTDVIRAGERRLVQRCTDVNECLDGKLNQCHPQARCVNLAGSYKCQCRRGYLGNGFECHKWFSSATNVAAYLHRHSSEEDEDAKVNETESGRGGSGDRTRVIDMLDDEDGQADDEADDDLSGAGNDDVDGRVWLVSSARQSSGWPPLVAPNLSESRWEPLKQLTNMEEVTEDTDDDDDHDGGDDDQTLTATTATTTSATTTAKISQQVSSFA